jgi:hypothetical protein
MTSCVAPDPAAFVAAGGKFGQSAASFAAASETLLVSTNSTEFSKTVYQAKFANGTINKLAYDKPLFPAADLAARRAALSTLVSYAAVLTEVSGVPDQGPVFKTSVTNFQIELSALATQIATMSPNQFNLAKFEQESSAVTGLVGTIGGMVISNMQADALINAILDAEKPMLALADNMEKDMALVFGLLRSAQILKLQAASNTLNIRACAAPLGASRGNTCQQLESICAKSAPKPGFCAWLESKQVFSQKERGQLVDAIKQAGDGVFANDQAKLTYGQALRAYRKAVSKLVAFAKSKRDPSTGAGVAAMVEIFNHRVSDLQIALAKSIPVLFPPKPANS